MQTILFLIVLLTSTAFLLKPIYDNDFFWHLKTGEWIWQNLRLPDHDIFNYTTSTIVTPAIKFTLTAYWLSQVMLYLAFLGSGMTGIVVLRFIFTAVIVYTMYKRQQGDGIINTSLLILLTVMILNFYFLERPQTLSFVCFGLLFFFIERIKSAGMPDNKDPAMPGTYLQMFLLAMTMLFWSNCHGGYLLGQVTLLIFLTMEGMKFFHHRLNPMTPAGYCRLLIAGFSGILCSLINPNNYQALLLMLQTKAGDPSTQIQEYSSMPEFYSMSHAPVIILYLTVMTLTGIVLVAFPKKIDITEIVLLSFLGYYAFMHVRYAAFFPLAALPVLGRRLSEGIVVRWGRWLLPPLALCTAVYTVSPEFPVNIATALVGKWTSDRQFPEKAADFVIYNRLQGNMYNPYDWGGYLIWRLAPERKVFADGRNLNTDIFLQSSLQSLQQKYGFNYIITYSFEPTGETTPMASELLMSREWVPVFSDRRSRSAIFVRNSPANATVIANNRLSSI